MKTIRLNSLKLKNFKGIRSFVLDATDDVAVYGDNATGKTTLADAFMWLLFNKDSQNRADFEIKTIKDGAVQSNLDHMVEATLEVDKKQVKLCKVFREKWTKRRGSPNKEFTGHETKYWIDDVPVKKADYTKKVSDIADESTFRLLTDPRYFNEVLHWQKRREILLAVCGDITDADVIASSDELAKLPEILGDRSLEDHRKVLFSRRQEVNKELEKLPVRIDEVYQGMPDISEIEPEQIRANIEHHKKEKAEAEAEIQRLQSGGQAAELQKKKADLEAEIRKLESKVEEDQAARLKAERKKLSEIETGLEKQNNIIRQAKNGIEQAKQDKAKKEKEIEVLRQQWHEENAKEFSEDTTCPTCGQTMPEDQIQAAREKFNTKKATKLAEITSQGKEAKKQIEACDKYIEQYQAEINKALAEYEKLQGQQGDIEAGIEEIKAENFLDMDQQAAKLVDEKDRLEDQIAKLNTGDNAEAIEKVQAKVAHAESQIEALNSSLARLDQHKQAQARIEELKAQEKKLAAEYEDLESQLYLTEQFVRQKVELLEEKINSKFTQARFKMFKENINGGLEETCIALVNGVPYPSANNAAQLNVGLDIINALSDYYGFTAPIWIDNAEAVTRLMDTNAQKIELVVSDQYPEMNVFKKEAKARKAS